MTTDRPVSPAADYYGSEIADMVRGLGEQSRADIDNVATALYCVNKGSAVDWPTTAAVLASEVYRLRAALTRQAEVSQP
jgi:hypothetical protein